MRWNSNGNPRIFLVNSKRKASRILKLLSLYLFVPDYIEPGPKYENAEMLPLPSLTRRFEGKFLLFIFQHSLTLLLEKVKNTIRKLWSSISFDGVTEVHHVLDQRLNGSFDANYPLKCEATKNHYAN